MQKFFISNFEVGKPSILFLWEISYRSANMLSVRLFRRNGTQKVSNAKHDARGFLKILDALQNRPEQPRSLIKSGLISLD
jgi:hypothetical protein